jgi:predicted phage gp36 major capsid-like protein
VNLGGDQEAWDKEMNRELEEAREEHENSLEKETKAHEEKMQEWKELLSECSA